MAAGFFFGLLEKREITVPSWKGWALLFLAAAALVFAAMRGLHGFLAVDRPLGGEALVVEGWIPDYARVQALAVFRARGYRRLIVTGGPLPPGMPFSSFGSHAELAAAHLKALGLGADSIVVLPTPFTWKDRTYLEATTLREWMAAQGRPWSVLDVFSFATHARRSRLLYAKALAGVCRVGVYAPADAGYDSRRWWASSNGVRSVVDETVGYLYVRCCFSP